MKPKVLIGGCGSTGSTLLRHILNRSPQIFSGPELNLFNKEQIFENWDQAKTKLLGPSRFLPTKGFMHYSGTRLLHPEYGWTRAELKALIHSVPNLETFVDKYFQKPIKDTNTIWIEKTPSNSYGFKYFLNYFKEGKVIHLARNPFDTVASFIRRDHKTYMGAGMYNYNMAMALRVQNHPRYYLIRYEDLVKNPVQEIQALFEFLGLDFDQSILFPKTTDQQGFDSWTNQPNKPISTSSVGRFQSLPENAKNEIHTALSSIIIRKKQCRKKDLRHATCAQICHALDYPFEPVVYGKYKLKLYYDFILDYLKRCYKLSPVGFHNYPIRLN